MTKVIGTLKYIQENGMRVFLTECYYRLANIFYEKYFDVNTEGYISTEDLGINHDESNHFHLPTHYSHIFTMLNKIPVDKTNSTILDYGCGKGRVLIAAASYQYKRIIGIELSDILNLAKSNINKMKHRNTQCISLEQGDAINFKVPPDVNIIFFYNPFRGSVLSRVISNIHASYDENPRKIYVIYINNHHFDGFISQQKWLTKICHTEIDLQTSCGLYETVNP